MVSSSLEFPWFCHYVYHNMYILSCPYTVNVSNDLKLCTKTNLFTRLITGNDVCVLWQGILRVVICFFNMRRPQKCSPQFLCSACLPTPRRHRTYFLYKEDRWIIRQLRTSVTHVFWLWDVLPTSVCGFSLRHQHWINATSPYLTEYYSNQKRKLV
jgi:hypothetical protein